jgi:hypothetical protein
MKISQLREVFRVAERQYRNDHKEDAADALSTFATNLLREDDAESVAALVKRVVKARQGQAARKAKSDARSKSKGAGKGRKTRRTARCEGAL